MTLYKANATIKTRKHQPINHSQQKGGTKNIMNELKLEFQLETTELPAELDKVLLSFLKAAVEKYSPAFFEKLYNKTSSVMKTYCLSMYLPGARFTPEKILLSQNRFSMTFSDADMGELIEFYNAFAVMKYKPYPMNQNSMKLMSLKAQRIPEIKDTELIIKMKSALIVRNHNSEDNSDKYYTCEDAEFEKMVTENLRIFLEKLNLEMDISSFSIMPVKAKKVVTKVWGRPADGSIGIFKITGTLELLNLLRMAGLGSRRSIGHGQWEVIY